MSLRAGRFRSGEGWSHEHSRAGRAGRAAVSKVGLDAGGGAAHQQEAQTRLGYHGHHFVAAYLGGSHLAAGSLRLLLSRTWHSRRLTAVPDSCA